MAKNRVKRILIYTHNSIGLGHAFRTLAVVTGMRHHRPDIEFLVVSGTSVPHIFFREGIELIKLPSVKLEIRPDGHALLRPRYLDSFELERLFDFRQRIIADTFEFFDPDVVMIEHNMTGQMNELIPLQLRKWIRRGGSMDFTLAYLCRGVMSRGPLLRIPYQNPRHRSESVNIGELYDFMYVLEDREVIDVNKEFLGDDPDLEPKIKYLGKITNKVMDELPPRAEVLDRFGLSDKRIIILSLGRYGRVLDLSRRLLEAFDRTGISASHQVVMMVDPYLDLDAAAGLRRLAAGRDVLVLPFIPNLIDLINHAEMIVCRAGYNTINEVLFTNTRALVIPEYHAGGEQELRARRIPQDNIAVAAEEEIIDRRPDEKIIELINRPVTQLKFSFDKYRIGRLILDDLEDWWAARAAG